MALAVERKWFPGVFVTSSLIQKPSSGDSFKKYVQKYVYGDLLNATIRSCETFKTGHIFETFKEMSIAYNLPLVTFC